MANHPGSKSCSSKSLDKTTNCLCEVFNKDEKVRAGTIEKVCGIDHNVAYACLETLSPHIGQKDIWDGICADKRRLIRKGLYVWWLDSPGSSFDWWVLVVVGLSVALNLSILVWQYKKRKESEISHACRANKWVIANNNYIRRNEGGF